MWSVVLKRFITITCIKLEDKLRASHDQHATSLRSAPFIWLLPPPRGTAKEWHKGVSILFSF